MGYSEQLAVIFALLCLEPKILGTYKYKETHREKIVKVKQGGIKSKIPTGINRFIKSILAVFKK